MSRRVTPPDWPRLQALIDEVLDASPATRDEVLARVSAGDAARREELARLLDECERGLPLLDQPAATRFAELLEDQPAQFPEALVDRYRPVRELGRGGMAAVFLARDLRHQRDVAVKIMRAELTAVLGRDRFLREIGIAARLRHPHIVPLFDSGEAGGVLYYVMPFEEGRSLRERLAQGPLPIREVLTVLGEVCDAIAYAHAQGIVHRDIKPDNILLAGRHALVSDFGIARAVSAASSTDAARTAGVLGTPAYMAPEHALGESPGDHRADIWALGVMAFEMLAGERPFGMTGPGRNPVGAAELPARLTRLRPDAPAGLARAVLTCLATDPDARYQSAAELLAALEDAGAPRGRRLPALRWAAAALAVGVVAAGLMWMGRSVQRRSGPVPGEAPRLAVTVFQHGGDAALEPLAIGLTDNLIGALGRVPGLVVRSMNAVLPYRDSMPAPDVLGRRLGVAWLVAGRLYRVGSEIVASVELTEASTGRLLARESRSATGEGVALIEELVPAVATMLRERVGDEVRIQSWRAGTRSDAAFAAVNRAHQERRDANRLAALRDLPGARLGLRRADSMLAAASRADPRWAEPHIQRALVALNGAAMQVGSGYLADSVPAVLREGLAHADAARRLAPASLRAREVFGLVLHELARLPAPAESVSARRAAAETVLREVADADTTMVDALEQLSGIYAARGDYEQAYVMADRAYRADAFHRSPQETLAGLFIYGFEAGEDREAAAWCAAYEARFPDDWFAGYCRLSLMVWGTAVTPVPDSALAIARRATASAERVIRPVTSAQLHTLAAGVMARAGDPAAARRMLAAVDSAAALDPLVTREPHGSVLKEISAGVHLRLGDTATAERLLRDLLSGHPDRAARLSGSRRFKDLPESRAEAVGLRP